MSKSDPAEAPTGRGGPRRRLTRSGEEIERRRQRAGELGRLLSQTTLATLPLPMRRQLLFLAHHRRIGHFDRPRTFNEKVNWRIIHDRREMLAWTCDKAETKQVAHDHGIPVPRTYWFGTDPGEIAFEDVPGQWVLKPNDRSGLVLLGNGAPPGREALRQLTAHWSHDHRVTQKGEWAYTRARSGFLLEERIGSAGGGSDYKVFVFDGEPHVVLVDVDRFGRHRSRFYTHDWRPLPYRDRIPVSSSVGRPRRLDDMLEAARLMAAGFDFLRVDFYLDDDEVPYVGEVSPYPGGGLEPFVPRAADFELGALWTLPVLPNGARRSPPPGQEMGPGAHGGA